MADPYRDIALGVQYPYHGQKPKDWSESAALGILHDLNDRCGIKHELAEIDDEVRAELVAHMAAIIRAAAL